MSESTFAGVVVKSVGVRKSAADLEDIEFLTCQEELQEQLLRKHLEVERVIGKKSYFNYFYCLILNDGARPHPYLFSLSSQLIVTETTAKVNRLWITLSSGRGYRIPIVRGRLPT